MSNPFYKRFTKPLTPMQPSMPNGMQNLGSLLSQFNRFKQTFTGDPKAQVEELLRSGQMTQEQFNQLSQTAQQFQQLLEKR